MGWKGFSLGGRGHDRDDDAIVDRGHDLHGRGNGNGHRGDDGDDCGCDDGRKGSDGSDGGWWNKGSDGSGSGSGDSHDDDYLCGGNDCIEVAENTTAVTDLDSPFPDATGDEGVVYAVLDCGDGALFTINPETGELAFREAPNFEAPADEGADNNYEVVVRTISTENPCWFTDTKLCVEVTDVDPEDSSGGQQSLRVVTTASTAPGDLDPSIALIAGTVVDQTAYSIVGADAGALQLVFAGADDPITDTLEFIVEVKNASLNTAATGGDSFYDFQVAMDIGAVDPILSEALHIQLTTAG